MFGEADYLTTKPLNYLKTLIAEYEEHQENGVIAAFTVTDKDAYQQEKDQALLHLKIGM